MESQVRKMANRVMNEFARIIRILLISVEILATGLFFMMFYGGVVAWDKNNKEQVKAYSIILIIAFLVAFMSNYLLRKFFKIKKDG